MTRTELRALIRKRLGETTAAFWLDTELNGWIDDAGRDLAFRTKSLRTNKYMTTSNTGEYIISTNLATDVITLIGVYYKIGGTTWTKLGLYSREEIDTRYPTWRSDTAGTPKFCYFDLEEDTIGFYPTPGATQYGSEYARVYYAKTYTPLANDNDSPAFPPYLHVALAHFATARGFETRGYGDKANDAWAKYEAYINNYLRERLSDKDYREATETSAAKGVGILK